MNTRLALGLGVLLVACGASPAPGSPLPPSSNARNGAGAGAVELRLSSGPAQFEFVYDVTITASGADVGTIRSRGLGSLAPSDAGAVLTRRVTTALAIDRDGAPMGNSSAATLAALSFVSTLGPRGELLESETIGADPADLAQRLAAQIMVPHLVVELPEADVVAGDTWTSRFDVPTFAILGFGTLACVVTSRLVAFEGSGDTRAAVVREEGPCTRSEVQAGAFATWDVTATWTADTRISVSDGVVRARSGHLRVGAALPDNPEFVMELGADVELRIERLAE